MKRDKYNLLQDSISSSIDWMANDVYALQKQYLKVVKKEFETNDVKGVRHYIDGKRELSFAIVRRLKVKMAVIIHDWFMSDKMQNAPFICCECGRDTREIKKDDGSDAA